MKLVLILLSLVFATGDDVANSSNEAAEMFERLVKRIPSDVEAHDVHKYVGKEFTYMIGGGNKLKQGVYMVPFIVSQRLYCVHIKDASPRVISVYRIANMDRDRVPVSLIGKQLFGQFEERALKPALSQIVDLHAAIDHDEVISEAELPYTLIYSSDASATEPE